MRTIEEIKRCERLLKRKLHANPAGNQDRRDPKMGLPIYLRMKAAVPCVHKHEVQTAVVKSLGLV